MTAETPRAELVATSKLRPAEWNPRTIDRERMENLRRSIREDPTFLWHRPVLALADGTVYGGNQRLRAAIAEGMSEVPAIVEDITLEQAKRRALKDNGSWGEWHEDQLAEMLYKLGDGGADTTTLGFDPGELERLLALVAGEEKAGEDEVPALAGGTAITKPGDLIKLGEHHLVCGDSRDPATWLRLPLTHGSAHAMWTDPPYGVNLEVRPTGPRLDNPRKAERTSGTAAFAGDRPEDVAPLLRAVFAQADAFLAPGAPWYIAGPHGPTFGAFLEAVNEIGWYHAQTLVWVKNGYVPGRSDYHYQHEALLYGWKAGAAHKWNAQADQSTVVDDEPKLSGLKRDELVRLVRDLRALLNTDVLREDKPRHNDLHPTMKPVALVRRMLRNSTHQGDIVLEPFGGSGSTLIACESMRRRAMVIELEPRFCDVIVERWEKYAQQEAERP